MREAEAAKIASAKAQEAETAELLANLQVKPFDLDVASDEDLQQAVIRKAGEGAGKDKRAGGVGGLVDDLMNSVVGSKTVGSRKRPSDGGGPPSITQPDGNTTNMQDSDTTSPKGNRKRARLALVGSQSDTSKQQAPQSKLHSSRIHAFATEPELEDVKLPPTKTGTTQRRLANVPFAGHKIFAGLVFTHVVSEKAVKLEVALKEQGAILIKEEDRVKGQHVDYIVTRL